MHKGHRLIKRRMITSIDTYLFLAMGFAMQLKKLQTSALRLKSQSFLTKRWNSIPEEVISSRLVTKYLRVMVESLNSISISWKFPSNVVTSTYTIHRRVYQNCCSLNKCFKTTSYFWLTTRRTVCPTNDINEILTKSCYEKSVKC